MLNAPRRTRRSIPLPTAFGVPAGQVERNRHRLYLRRFCPRGEIANKLADVYTLGSARPRSSRPTPPPPAQRPDRGVAPQAGRSGSRRRAVQGKRLERARSSSARSRARRRRIASFWRPISPAIAMPGAPRHGRGAGASGHRSRAHAAMLPSFPQRGPISLLVAVATALLSLAYVLPRALIGSPAVPRQASDSRLRTRRAPSPPPANQRPPNLPPRRRAAQPP